jgi:DNA processing protein
VSAKVLPAGTPPGVDGRIEREEFAAWWCLVHTPALSRRAARHLLAAFGSPQAVLRAAPPQWRAVAGEAAASALARALQDDPMRLSEPGWAWHAAQPTRHHLLTLDNPAYPPLLLAADDPPLMLYAVGESDGLAALQREALAIVGSRQATVQGRTDARAFARHLAQAGWVIVSGLAAGIDAAAHEGALEGGGWTVAVMGTGPDGVYPARHRALAERIAARGLLLSEWPPGTPPRAEHFPQRNRIIAALTRGTLVVEAALQSGSLITARLALESGREVFAIPGSIHAPQSRGCHALIRQGAKLVETVDDVLTELPCRPGCTDGAGATGTSAGLSGGGGSGGLGSCGDGRLKGDDPGGRGGRGDRVNQRDPGDQGDLHGPSEADDPADPDDQAAPDGAASAGGAGQREDAALLEALGHAPVTLDALCARTGWSSANLAARLLDWELEGRVARLPGGLFQRLARG